MITAYYPCVLVRGFAVKKSVSTKISPANIAAIMDILAETPVQIERWGAALSSDGLHQPIGPGERSLTEVLAHLINCEARTADAIYLALLVDQPMLHNIHPERQWGMLLGHALVEFADLMGYFKFRRMILMRVLSSLTDSQWQRVVREEGKQRQESVYWLARTLALHELEHLTDLQVKLGRHSSA